MPPPNTFLNGQNYNNNVRFLRQHYVNKLGTNALPERMETRLQNTVKHYMQEVNEKLGTSKPLPQLNQETIRETVNSIDNWLRKQESAQPPTTTTIGALSRGTNLFADTSSRYEAVMAERAPPVAAVPPQMPDFTIGNTMLESEEDPVVLMERMAKQREDQTRSMGINPPKLEIREETAPSAAAPTPPQAEAPPPLLAPRPQDYIIPQEDVTKYRETEYNVFLTSSDRDWTRNTNENRYNFTVNFNASTTQNTKFNYNASLQNRFRNIQRIEFVKAIVPIESLTPIVRVAQVFGPTPTYDTTRVVNIFSLPFTGVRIQELENNGFSTSVSEDTTFAIVQYDTFWSSDLTSPAVNGTNPVSALTKSGYTGLIPKYLKTQKIYTPTPLATLQRLSIRLEKHNGSILSTDSDVQMVQRIVLSSAYSTVGTNSTLYADVGGSAQNSYIFVQTSKYFSYSAVGEGDNIQFQNYSPMTASPAASDFVSYINRTSGFYVVAVAYVNGAGAIVDGRNDAGFCNVIILRSRFDDPTTGSTGRASSYYGGSAGAETTLAGLLDNTGDEPNQTSCALINLSRQVHIVLRIVTRDVDSSANIRPDNV